MAKIGEVYGSGSVLNAADLAGKGDVPVTIESTKLVKFDDGNKILATFRGKEKGLAVNFTNANTLAEISGSDESDDWVGLRVLLYVTKVPFGPKMVDSIRIKPLADAPKPKAPPLTADDIPFSFLLPFVLPLTAALATVLA